MKSYNWFGVIAAPERSRWLEIFGRFLIGLLAGLLVFLGGSRILAIVIWSLSGTVGLLSAISPGINSAITGVLGRFGKLAAQIVAWIILIPIFFLFFPLGRLFSRIRNVDALNLRTKSTNSYWSECDSRIRKERNVQRMFATEPTVARRRSWLFVGLIVVITVLFAEVGLRVFGFGNPVLYQPDSLVGYYPAPKQETDRLLGNRIYINSYGMRAPEYSVSKPDGTFRIFMIGDSTLYGGSYVDQQKLYARLLEEMLKDSYQKKVIQILNIGVNSWGPFHKLGYVEKFGSFDSDIAVICLPIGDILRGKTTLWELPYMSVDRPPRFALEEVAVHMLWRYWRGLSKGPRAQIEQGQILTGVKTYVQLAEELRKRGSEVFVEILPTRSAGLQKNVPATEAQRVAILTEAMATAGFKVGYPVGLFSNIKSNERVYHDGSHLDVDGHRYYAEYLLGRLTSVSSALKVLEIE